MTEKPAETNGIAIIKSQYVVKNEENGEVPSKRPRLDSETEKKPKGQFKNRYHRNKLKLDFSKCLCNSLIDIPEDDESPPRCKSDKCKFLHDVKKYLQVKPPDIGDECCVFNTKGYCPRGVTCRFGKKHITPEGRNIKCPETIENYQINGQKSLTFITRDLQMSLRKRKYNFSKSVGILEKLPNYKSKDDEQQEEESNKKDNEEEAHIGPCPDEDLFKLHIAEKKKIDWKNKLYLSPLTTLGNLPFRRICKEFGADITCGEMAMATSILQSLPYEWALLKRHESENLFGVQLCGNNPYAMTKCAQLVEETANVDFIDVNLGCPIDAVYQRGGGSGLLRRGKTLQNVVRCMSQVTNLPLTIKTRTGVYADKNIAHKLIPVFTAAGVSLITVHGRSREQRYTKTPDWNYINECAGVAAPTPVFGNGDILSYEDYTRATSTYNNITGVMIGRGALYKPWIFTEIKEQRDWDISSSERLKIIKKYVDYGLDHWGSDTKGVECTRRFTLEWLSFLCRYIPVGLLERPPQKINQRPPTYCGRDDLETLMASPNCADWVKITEMLLGPVPENFHFLPKHKANSWASD